jgi:Stress responsive A/B Barrel Domain
MHHITLMLAGLVAAAASFSALAADESANQGKALYHVVSIKFKEGAAQEKIKAVEEAFAALKGKIPGIASLHYGTNVSPENKNKGFTHCFVLTFTSEKDRDAYLVHPDHKAFGKVLGPVVGDVMVIDFWARE